MAKQDEQRIMDYINFRLDLDLKLAKDEFSPFDAESSKFIFEFKVRNKFYGDLMLEESKVIKMLNIAKDTYRVPYFVQVNEGIYRVCQIVPEYNKRKFRAPRTTDFNDNNIVWKDFAIFNEFNIL